MATVASAECQVFSRSENQAAPSLAVKAHDPRKSLEEMQLHMRAPRIGFAQLLPPLLIAWISNCNKTSVAVLPTILARIIQAAVLVSLLSMCENVQHAEGLWSRRKRSQVLSFLSQALCILLLIDLLRLDPVEAQALVSTADWREETAKLFRR
ncbi:hypothetical protein Slin15195_G028770 [Septoria linicola]|uniref:Uncharacterized protein n=1 Tax=Septoria linicola TaxID=215465 RepID=A0A9Q9ANY3_9PEZI|nr:hypothetical protein Slin14017_G027810 [Septoria linicola]USW49558.1 hypothetical protein Slin15195_G028770 [Septoria linicola]